MLSLDLTGKRALVAGVADDVGFGFAIAKSLAEAGAKVSIAGWPPALGIFQTMLNRGKFDDSRRLSDGSLLEFEFIYPLDASFDSMEDVPEDIRTNRRYRDRGDFTIKGLAARIKEDMGRLDILVHSLANGSEVHLPLIEVSRQGYLGAVGVSAYSMVSLMRELGPLMKDGGSAISLTYLAAERVIPGYGGGMSAAKAALESDTRTLAYQLGHLYGMRINTISAGPVHTRAANVTGIIGDIIEYYEKNSPLPRQLTTDQVGHVAAFLSSPLASAITGTTLHVDNGFHAMGKALSDSYKF